eukprot:13311852-Alexandrium_andersonii.AAC.1
MCIRDRNIPRASQVPTQRQGSVLVKDDSGTSVPVLVIKGRDPRAILARPVLRTDRLREDAVDQAVA